MVLEFFPLISSIFLFAGMQLVVYGVFRDKDVFTLFGVICLVTGGLILFEYIKGDIIAEIFVMTGMTLSMLINLITILEKK